jgi:hypothetical protein
METTALVIIKGRVKFTIVIFIYCDLWLNNKIVYLGVQLCLKISFKKYWKLVN